MYSLVSEEKTRGAIDISTNLSATESAEEKILVAESLEILAVSEEEVVTKLLELISDDNAKVNSAAGRALDVIKVA